MVLLSILQSRGAKGDSPTHEQPLGLGGPRQHGTEKLTRHLHMLNSGNRTPDCLILSPVPFPFGHVLLQTQKYCEDAFDEFSPIGAINDLWKLTTFIPSPTLPVYVFMVI